MKDETPMTALNHTPRAAEAPFAEHAQTLAGRGPAMFAERKQAALEVFQNLGLPTTRDEDWKYTSVAPIRDTEFALAEDVATELTADDIKCFAIPDLEGSLLVFINGQYAAELSFVDELPDGVRVTTLTEAARTDRDLVDRHLNACVKWEKDAFSALNTACMEDGVFVHVPANKTVEKPIHVLSITANGDQPIATHPRNLILADENAEVTVIEHYVAMDETVYFTNAVTEIFADAHARVDHYVLERESEKAFCIQTLAIKQLREANVKSHTLLFGGALVRNNVNPQIDGEHGECLINGMYAPTGTQHIDNHMFVEHNAPHGDSRQFYKGILLDHGTAVFAGRIRVAQIAQKTDAKQTNGNLLLSPDATINTKPQLEIYADDVKCTHGATVGQLDTDALFYLESRGISKEAARGLMVYSFAAESFERIGCEPVRRYLEQLLVSRLPQGKLLENVL